MPLYDALQVLLYAHHTMALRWCRRRWHGFCNHLAGINLELTVACEQRACKLLLIYWCHTT